MRAVIITRPGPADVLEIQTRPDPVPGAGQVRIRVAASGLNRADLMQREGLYPPPPDVVADIPGLEYAGEIESLGAGVSLWTVGDRVMGIASGGAHAELLCVHEREVMPMPADLSLEEAAAIPEAFLTAFDALRRLDVGMGERVLVHAVASGVGTAALQLAHAAGAVTIGTSRSSDKLDRARAFGLDHPIDSSDDWAPLVEAAVGASAVHAVVDLVGGEYLGGDLRVLRPRGRIVVVGLTGGRRASMDLGLLLAKRATVIGTVLRSRPLEEKAALARRVADRIVPMFDRGILRPVVDRVMSFTDVRAAHEVMASNATFGKVVLRWD
jgi:NADPH2:quinone reductase